MRTGTAAVAIATSLIAVFVATAPAGNSQPGAFDPGKTYPVEALKEDLEVLWDILEELTKSLLK